MFLKYTAIKTCVYPTLHPTISILIKLCSTMRVPGDLVCDIFTKYWQLYTFCLFHFEKLVSSVCRRLWIMSFQISEIPYLHLKYTVLMMQRWCEKNLEMFVLMKDEIQMKLGDLCNLIHINIEHGYRFVGFYVQQPCLPSTKV